MSEIRSPHGSDIWLVERVLGVEATRMIDFSSNVNPFGPSPKAIQALLKAAWMVSSYPDDSSLKLREKLSEKYGLKPSNFIVGNGSTEIIYMFSSRLIAGGFAGIHIPTFSEYERAVEAYGGKCLFTKPCVEGQPEVDEFLKLMERGAKAIFICNPNNPNGALMRRKDLEEVIYEADRRGIPVLLDEDFVELTVEKEVESFTREVERFKNLVVLRSFTKSHGLAGLRVGYAVAQAELVKRLEEVRTRWNVNLLAQEAAAAALDDVKHVEAAKRLILQEKPYLEREIAGVSLLEPLRGYANFLLVRIREGGLKSPELKVKLARRGILIRDCRNFRGLNEHYFRVAVRRRWENERLLEELRGLFQYRD